ncbi:MAG: PKD domain-containing protein, partial [Flavobacteriales bacterium]
ISSLASNTAIAQCPTVADFVLNPSQGCAIPHTVFFTDQSTLPDTWLWNFGDGNTSTLQNPVHNYTTTGTFTVTLTVVDTIVGCSDVTTMTVFVTVVTSEFSASAVTGSSPLTTTFTDLSSISGPGTIDTWAWDFGDGNTSTMQNPTHTYNEGGDFTVSLTTTASNGCSSTETKSNYIQVTGPVATCQDITVELDGTGNYNFDTPLIPQTDAEQLVPAGVYTNTSAVQSFTATEDGVLHSVSLGFSSAYTPGTGKSLLIEILQGSTISLLVYPDPVSISSGLNEFVLEESVEIVSGVSYSIFIYTDGSAFSLQKNDGDPYAGGNNNISATSDFVFSTKILQRPEIDNGSTAAVGLASFGLDVSSFTCANVGANTVTLTATDNNAATSTCTSTVTVEDNENPIAACQNITAYLDGTGNVSITAADIDAGSTDNCTLNYAASQTTFTCANHGANSVTLTVTDPASNTDDCVSVVTVLDTVSPNANCQPFTVVLDGSGSGTITTGDIDNASSDNCGIASMSLDMTTFNCSNIGPNTVELTVTDVNGLVSTCTETVTVEDNEDPILTCPGNIIVCADNASGATVNYILPTATDNCNSVVTQTDGSGLTSGNVFPLGPTAQQWTATDGTNSVVCNFIVGVNPKPEASYSFTAACEGESTFFTDASTIDASSDIVSWEWDMDDGSSSIGLVDPIHAFGDTGMYDVELVVISTEGCSDTATQTVHVTPVPVAGFTFVGACEGNPTVFTNTSTIDAGNLNYAWDFGDSNTSTDQDPSHTYALDGTYTVTLTVTSDNGCEDVSTQSVTVNDSPTALFSASTECEGTATVFTNLSTGDGTLTYNWDFGDSSPLSTDANPTHTYLTDGVYTVVLTTTNDNGCVDVHTASVTVNNLPAASFTFSDVCEGTAADFVNTSDAGTYNWDLGDGSSSTLTDVSHVYSA